ncbi:hypothetical protein CPT_Mendera_295 [Stenotrophomonas phage Mendera]|uniref:Uncharacterized protein n=1 Tax=Stenotrophomonas phage Mendera TaxID=2650877 RepID=A0A5P8PJB6_9CAUD|nr:hypothetical protein HWC60_gp120 [Stenotrophomonas phage Mendera]QFR56821.1 hypothetical protein CPT_Mendera_295 [Stenotrophomonas phage Mendera]
MDPARIFWGGWQSCPIVMSKILDAGNISVFNRRKYLTSAQEYHTIVP